MRVAVVAVAPALRAGLRVLLEQTAAVQVVAEAATLADAIPLPPEFEALILVSPPAPEVADLEAVGETVAPLLLSK